MIEHRRNAQTRPDASRCRTLQFAEGRKPTARLRIAAMASSLGLPIGAGDTLSRFLSDRLAV